jgi:hypothetical protein
VTSADSDPYGSDVLAGFSRRAPSRAPKPAPLEVGLVVEWADSGFTGAVIGVESGLVQLEDRHGDVRVFPLGRGYLIDGEAVELIRPAPKQQPAARTASGSFAVRDQPARVALPSRIFVEGRHDAELVEKVWGDDLRVEGVVVEYLEGVDLLADVLREFGPGPDRRVGVLVDHLVPGSKESRIAASVEGPDVLVVGHPFIDIWAAVKPARLGIAAWPEVPRGVDWKTGVCAVLGWPHADRADFAHAWQRILGSVRGWQDLEPELLGRVEQLIDFVSTPRESETA